MQDLSLIRVIRRQRFLLIRVLRRRRHILTRTLIKYPGHHMILAQIIITSPRAVIQPHQVLKRRQLPFLPVLRNPKRLQRIPFGVQGILEILTHLTQRLSKRFQVLLTAEIKANRLTR